MSQKPIEFTPYERFPSEPAGQAGITHRIAAKASDGIGIVHVVEYEPGVVTNSGVQCHEFWEYVYIIDGSMIDLTLNQEFTAGSVAVRPPGMKHGPWRIPEGGCRLFEVKCRNPLE